MKKCTFIVILILSISFLTSCSATKNIDLSKEYLDEYYTNFNQSNYTQCFYQLNKNSVDMLSSKYEIGAQDYLAVRKSLLGQTIKYDIVGEEYSKVGKDKFVDFVIDVQYKSLIIQEKIQIIIKKDGQVSINTIDLGEDNVIDEMLLQYSDSIISQDNDKIIQVMSPYYFEKKTETNLRNMINQMNELGGKLSGCEFIESNYLYDEIDGGVVIYEALLKMNFEDVPMLNKIKIIVTNGTLGVGYTVIQSEKVLMFLENYKTQLNSGNQDAALSLYSSNFLGESDDAKNNWWKRLEKYNEKYGLIQEYDVVNMGLDKASDEQGNEIDIIRLEVDIQYKDMVIKNNFILLNEDAYKIHDQFFSDN